MKNTKNVKKAATRQSKRINASFKLLLFFSLFSLYLILGLTVHASTKTEKKATTVNTDPIINVTDHSEEKQDSSWGYNFGPEEFRDRHYSILLKVVDIDDGNTDYTYWVILESCTGNKYSFEMDRDVRIDDYYTAIVNDNGTPEVKDDKIISVKYERPDLFVQDTF